jgi:S1-C subfamily serine protease
MNTPKIKSHRVSILTSLLLIVSLASGAIYLNAANDKQKVTPREVTPRGELTSEELSTIDIFEKSKKSVVFISTKQRVRDFWTRNVFSVPSGTGSGFIWDRFGHIITNYHVIKGASEAVIRLEDGRDYKAKLIGASPAHDIAVLKIDVPTAPPPEILIGESETLRVGQTVYAIGNPFGLDWTLTTGIVSALDRSLSTDGGQDIEHLIQTDAAINPGNSGGPLLDSAGRLIGINTAIYSPSGTSAGIGFAVPVDTINRVVPQLIRFNKYTPPGIGVYLDPGLNKRITTSMKIRGVAVLKVTPDSSADKAGIEPARLRRDGVIVPGDVITHIEQRAVETVSKFNAILDSYRVNDEVTLTIHRHGESFKVKVTVQAE